MKISEVLVQAARALAESGVPNSVRESRSLLLFALRRERVFLFSHPEYELTDLERKRFENAVERRRRREPLQYITGRQEFFGLDFAVTPDVLIPRPETEMLVAKTIELLPEGGLFAEIGVGSGCICISVLANRSDACAFGSDLSLSALNVASLNARRHLVSDRLELIESDVFENFADRRFDIIVSNPPYIAVREIDFLQPEVGLFEPRAALTDGSDGVSIIHRLVRDAKTYLCPGGYLIMEIGIGQEESVSETLELGNWIEIDLVPDFQNIPRMVVARMT